MVSHISLVSAVRTDRALTRAVSMQLRIEEGLVGEKARNSVTVSSFGIGGEESRAAASCRDRRFPFVRRAHVSERERSHPVSGFEDAGEIFRALDITGEPVKIVGGARQHLLHNPIDLDRLSCSARPRE